MTEHLLLTDVNMEKEVVDRYISEMEEQFSAGTDALASLVEKPVPAPESLTEEEVDARFAEAVQHIKTNTSPEEREDFRELRMNKVSGDTQLKILSQVWE
jgi:hypothetical protein